MTPFTLQQRWMLETHKREKKKSSCCILDIGTQGDKNQVLEL